MCPPTAASMPPQNSSITITEFTRVSPPTNSSPDSPNSPNSLFTLPLTYLDLLWLKMHPVERVFFYRHAESTHSFFNSVLIPKLKSSLSSTLLHFLPLAGRLVWDHQEPKPSIRYAPNDGVSVKIASFDAAGDFSYLTGNEQRLAAGFHQLIPELEVSDESADILALQITLFPNQGFCIGVTAHHAVLDGKTTSMFMKAWAHMCKHDVSTPPRDLTPSFDRTVIKDAASLEMRLLYLSMSFYGKEKIKTKSLRLAPKPDCNPDLVRITLELTREAIERLKQRVRNESAHGPSTDLHVSAFVVAYAYVFTCMVKARGGDPDRQVCLGLVADCRNRLNPPVQPTYFGNCLAVLGNFDLTAGLISETKGFSTAAKTLGDLIKGLNDVSVVEKYEEMLDHGAKRMKPGCQFGSVAGSRWLGLYESDFGWGRPVKIEVVAIDYNEAISLAESGDGSGGMEIGLSLQKHEMNIVTTLFVDGLK